MLSVHLANLHLFEMNITRLFISLSAVNAI